MSEDDLYLDILSDKNVLCVDDEVGILNNLASILENFFHAVKAVSDPEEALYEFNSGFYDVMICDVSMPKIDGLELIQQIREKNKKVPIIILSGHTEYENIWKAVNLKITKYLTKPCKPEELMLALKEISMELVDYKSIFKLSKDCQYNFLLKQIESKNCFTKLSKSESRLLEYFIKNLDRVISYENILEYMYEFDQPSKEAIKSIVKDLRKKICSNLIKNVYGVGYRCEVQL